MSKEGYELRWQHLMNNATRMEDLVKHRMIYKPEE